MYPQPQPSQAPQSQDKDKVLFGQQADYRTEEAIENRLSFLKGVVNQQVYSQSIETDADSRAAAETIVSDMIFFVTKGKNPTATTEAEKKVVDVKEYDEWIEQLRKTRRPKKIRNILEAAGRRFAADARVLGYTATKAKKKLPGTDFLLNRLQLREDMLPEDMEFMKTLKGWFKPMCFIFACQLVRGDGDVPLLLTGAPGFQKGQLAIRICRRTNYYVRTYKGFGKFANATPKWDINKDILWAGEAKEGLNAYYGLSHYNMKIVDDAYMDALNLESNQGKAIFIGKVINVTRSKNNMTIFCYQVPTRATAFLYEAFYLWIHKYMKLRAILLARTKVMTVKDMWGIKKLMDSESEDQIIARLAGNKNKVKTFKPKPLPNADFEEYEKTKHAHQEEYRVINESKKIIDAALDRYAVVIRKAVEAKNISPEANDQDVEMFIRKKYPQFSFKTKQIKSILHRYRELDMAMAVTE